MPVFGGGFPTRLSALSPDSDKGVEGRFDPCVGAGDEELFNLSSSSSSSPFLFL
jgi:hypothetical protein